MSRTLHYLKDTDRFRVLFIPRRCLNSRRQQLARDGYLLLECIRGTGKIRGLFCICRFVKVRPTTTH